MKLVKCYVCSAELDLDSVHSDVKHLGWERLTQDRIRAEYRCPKHRQTNPQLATIGELDGEQVTCNPPPSPLTNPERSTGPLLDGAGPVAF